MSKIFIDTENLNTISDCLEQLANAEAAQLSIELRLAQPAHDGWRNRAEFALRTVKGKRRLITSRLAILRQQQKELNRKSSHQHNKYLIEELRRIVTPSSFERCNRRAAELRRCLDMKPETADKPVDEEKSCTTTY